MSRILYCVSGEGWGHAIRSKVIIDYLMKKHEVLVLSYGKGYKYFNRYFSKKNLWKIHGFFLVYEDIRVRRLKTGLDGFVRSPKIINANIKQFRKVMKSFKPQIIVSDTEPFSGFFAKLYNIPVLAVDNTHILSQCQVEVPKRHKKDFILAKNLMQLVTPYADYYLITTFFYPRIKNPKNTFLFPPILRKKILNAKKKLTKKEHIIVYQTAWSYKQLFPILKMVKANFIVYASGKSGKDKNITFKDFNETTFIKDLSSCKAIITNGGFTLISEAVYLGKPLLCVPVKQQPEQVINAYYVDKLGYGKSCDYLTPDIVNNFIDNIKKYEKSMRKHRQDGNKKIFKKLDQVISVLLLK